MALRVPITLPNIIPAVIENPTAPTIGAATKYPINLLLTITKEMYETKIIVPTISSLETIFLASLLQDK